MSELKDLRKADPKDGPDVNPEASLKANPRPKRKPRYHYTVVSSHGRRRR